MVRSSKTITVRGKLVEPLVPRQYWPSTRPSVLSKVEKSVRTDYLHLPSNNEAGSMRSLPVLAFTQSNFKRHLQLGHVAH